MSSRKRCESAPAGVTSSARPAIFASPGQSGGSGDPLWMAKRGSRWRSSALTARDIDPMNRSPSANSTSVPLIRGDPSRRSVAIVLCVKPSNSDRARAASSGSCASTSLHLAMGHVYRSAPAAAPAATAAWP